MGNTNSIVHTKSAYRAADALDTLVVLARQSEQIKLMSDKDLSATTITMNSCHATGDWTIVIQEIIKRQRELAVEMEVKIIAARERQAEAIRKSAKVFVHFNDGDGDDIRFSMNSGECKVNINGAQHGVSVVSANPPHLTFEYNTGNRWVWTVNFETKQCVGNSPRTFLSKNLDAIAKTATFSY